MVGRAVRKQGVQIVCLVGTVGIHGQLLAECLLLPAVCKPVVDADFSDQVGAQAMGFGGGDTSLQTFCPEDGQWERCQGEGSQGEACWCSAPDTQSQWFQLGV